MWDEITYPFPNSNGETVEVWESISNFFTLYWTHTSQMIKWIDIIGFTNYAFVSCLSPNKTSRWHIYRPSYVGYSAPNSSCGIQETFKCHIAWCMTRCYCLPFFLHNICLPYCYKNATAWEQFTSFIKGNAIEGTSARLPPSWIRGRLALRWNQVTQ